MNEQHADVTALSLHPGVGPTGLGKVRTWDIVRVFWDIVRVYFSFEYPIAGIGTGTTPFSPDTTTTNTTTNALPSLYYISLCPYASSH